jgi:hypothetical protein
MFLKKLIPITALSIFLGVATYYSTPFSSEVSAKAALQAPQLSNFIQVLGSSQFQEQIPVVDEETGEIIYEVKDAPSPLPEYEPTERDTQIPQAYIAPDHPLHQYYKQWEKAPAKVRADNVIYSTLVGHYLEGEGRYANAGSVAWGDVHMNMFDGAVCDSNNSIGWHDYSSKGQSGFGREQLNVNKQAWHSNKKTTVIVGYALTANYQGETFQFLYPLGGTPTVNGKAISVSSTIKPASNQGQVWFSRPNGNALIVATPATEYSLTYQSGGYGNLSIRPRVAPHVGGFYDGMIGQSIRFDGKVVGNNGKTTSGTTCDNKTIVGKSSDYRTSGPFAYNSARGSRYTSMKKERVLDGFYPIAPVALK